jgi:SAM-dependent methyltransferase
MMLPFDKRFLDMLPVFKKGFRGVNEMGDVQAEIIKMKPQSTENWSFLDVGSADGEWLRKTMIGPWNSAYFPDAEFTALEPIDNLKLQKLCEGTGVKWKKCRIEESDLADESFDIITSTHTAYYFYNQPLAHEELFRLLKPEGMLIVTMVSQFCVLNTLTTSLLAPHRQFSLNAESYITLMSKLGMFQLEKAMLFRGGSMDHEFYSKSDDNLRALAYVLARHRLPRYEIDDSMNSFRATLQQNHAVERKNLIMFFRKKTNGSNLESQREDAQRHLRKRSLDLAIGDLRAKIFKMPEASSEGRQPILRSYVETFATEAIRESLAQRVYLDDLKNRILDDVRQQTGPVNEILEQLDRIIGLSCGE